MKVGKRALSERPYMRAGSAEVDGEVFGTGDPSPTRKPDGALEDGTVTTPQSALLTAPLTRGAFGCGGRRRCGKGTGGFRDGGPVPYEEDGWCGRRMGFEVSLRKAATTSLPLGREYSQVERHRSLSP